MNTDKHRCRSIISYLSSSVSICGLTDCDVLTIQDLVELHGSQDPALQILLACMFAELNRGSLCLKIPSATFSAVLANIVISPDAEAEGEPTAHARAIQDKLQGEEWRDLIGEPGNFTPLIRVPAAAGDALYLYFQRYYEYERRVRAQIEARINAQRGLTPISGSLEIGCLSPLDTNQAGEVVREVLASRPANVKWELVAAQKAALALAMRQRFLIISGGPGTGKTTCVVSILRCLVRLGCQPQRILLAAPTGRAAYRLTDSLRKWGQPPLSHQVEGGNAGRTGKLVTVPMLSPLDQALLSAEACTIHRLLQYRPSRHDFARHAGNPLQADVVVIDEVSMVDAGLMASLLEAVPQEARLIFLGDKDQLPSIAAGAILADLIPAAEAPNYSEDAAQWVRTVAGIPWGFRGQDPDSQNAGNLDHVVVLTENHRAADTNIAEVVKCLTGFPDQKAIETRLFAERIEPIAAGETADDSKILSCLWPAGAAPPRGYHFIELTPEWAGREEWSRFLRSWAWHHYLAPHSTSTGGTPVLLSPMGRGGCSYRELLLQAAAEGDFIRPGGFSSELAADILRRVRNAQILTILRNGRFGCTGVNATLMHYLGPKLGGHAAQGYFPGLPILITRNNYEMDLFNGDVGVVLRDKNGLYRAFFERQQLRAGVECFGLDQLPPWEPALAITVHKSQGSEYAEVLLLVPPDVAEATAPHADEPPAQRLLTAEILYTGLTRASRLVLLCGTKETIMQAAMRRVERSSGLAQQGPSPQRHRDAEREKRIEKRGKI